MVRRFSVTLLSFLTLISSSNLHGSELNVYSARKNALIRPALDMFAEATGTKVNLITASADALIERLKMEGALSPADILITTDAGRLGRAVSAGLLKSVSSKILNESIPPNLRDPKGRWYGMSVRARPIVYSKNRVDPTELSTYEDLVSEKFHKRICIRSSSNIYNQSLIASMIASNGEESVTSFARGIVNNLSRPPSGGDRDQIRAVAAGVCDIAIVNTYYLAGMIKSKDSTEVAAAKKVDVFWPNQNDRGTHINISGAGVAKHATNTESAVQLMEFLITPKVQEWYARINGEYPVINEIPPSSVLAAWGDFKHDSVNLSLFGQLNAEAVRIMDRVGWR
ncbi:MAG: Fe(3+) ABC transporter substrate-binding protein [Gemmatimonadetes bacterium]|jgi:iron(III) transport system substrate-binding protein|nr:Fe(3+) ABC transporter substrate-binding protein [Gemmatimonadota bacterium]